MLTAFALVLVGQLQARPSGLPPMNFSSPVASRYQSRTSEVYHFRLPTYAPNPYYRPQSYGPATPLAPYGSRAYAPSFRPRPGR